MKYLIGIDFGTLSARAILTNETGDIISQSSSEYAHGVMDGVTEVCVSLLWALLAGAA